MDKVTIGDRVVHRINGFAGVVTGETKYINGCRQFLVAPEDLDKDGKIVDGMWIDEQHLTIKTPQVFPDPFKYIETATAGGPDLAARRTDV